MSLSASAVQQSPYYHQAPVTSNPVTAFPTAWPFQSALTPAFPPSLANIVPGILAPESIIGVSSA